MLIFVMHISTAIMHSALKQIKPPYAEIGPTAHHNACTVRILFQMEEIMTCNQVV